MKVVPNAIIMAEKSVFQFPGPYGPEKSGFSALNSVKSDFCPKLYHFGMIFSPKTGKTVPNWSRNGKKRVFITDTTHMIKFC